MVTTEFGVVIRLPAKPTSYPTDDQAAESAGSKDWRRSFGDNRIGKAQEDADE